MHINEIEALAQRLRSLQRRTYTFGKNREQVIEEIGMIASDLEAYVARLDHDMDMEYMADHAEYVRG
jgi:hypothetical protein